MYTTKHYIVHSAWTVVVYEEKEIDQRVIQPAEEARRSVHPTVFILTVCQRWSQFVMYTVFEQVERTA